MDSKSLNIILSVLCVLFVAGVLITLCYLFCPVNLNLELIETQEMTVGVEKAFWGGLMVAIATITIISQFSSNTSAGAAQWWHGRG